MYSIRRSTKFKRDVKRCQKQGKDMEKFKEFHEILMSGQPLPYKYKDHPLKGEFTRYRDCHIEPDWLLIYRIDEDEKIIEYLRMGSHSDLFG